jgi:polyisoprenoid-binding protein YceI
MKKRSLLFYLAFFFVLSAYAQKSEVQMEQFFPIEASHSYIEFSVKYMGYARVKGRFSEFSGMLRYNEADLLNTSVTLSIKVSSIDTDLDFRDNDLKSANWFDANTFPVILFKSKRAVKTSDGFDVIGDITIKGITKETTLHLSSPSGVLKDVRGDAQVIFTGTTSINRNDFGVEGKNWSAVKEGITAVDSEVKIEFSILAKQVKAANFSNRVRNDQQPAGKLYKQIKEKGVNAGLEEFQRMFAEKTVDEKALQTAGRMVLLEGNINDAIKVLAINQKSFPQSSNASFYLGEAYALNGDWSNAKINFEQSLKLDPGNCDAIEVMRHLH